MTDNKEEYIKLVTKAVIIDFCEEQYETIKQGFNEIIPLECVSLFTDN